MHPNDEFPPCPAQADRSRRSFLRTAGGLSLATVAGAGIARTGTPPNGPAVPEVRNDLMAYFRQLDVDGCFALLDADGGRQVLVNARRAQTRLVPASTYKVAHSVIAFGTGAVRDPEQVQPYGGGRARFAQWERDMTLREAIAASNVPLYQGIARRIGMQRMQAWVDRLDYGNRQLGDRVDQFWLRGPLKISAAEQTRFLARLAKGKLPASERSQRWVREMMRVETTPQYAIYAKTGWAMDDGLSLGWWVGWVERAGRIHTFALNMDVPRDELAAHRLPIAKAMLEDLGVLPSAAGKG